MASSGLAQGAANGVSGARVQGTRLTGGAGYGFAGPSAAQRVNILLRHQDGSVVGIEAAERSAINLRGAEFSKPRVSPPRVLALVHLKQSLPNARVDAGDVPLDFHALACKEVLIVVVTIIRGDATGVAQRGSGQVADGVSSARGHAAQQEPARSQCLVKLSNQFCATTVRRVETRRERASSVRV